MATTDTISIKRLKNNGRLSIVAHFTLAGNELSVDLPGGSSIDRYTIPLGAPGDVLAFTARAEDTTLYDIKLFYTVEDARNQFYFTVLKENEEGTPQPAISATTPGRDIELILVCDGVVIVGTGDL